MRYNEKEERKMSQPKNKIERERKRDKNEIKKHKEKCAMWTIVIVKVK